MDERVHCFVINLDRSKQRLEMQGQILDRAKIQWTRVQGVDGKDLLPELKGLDQKAFDFRHGKKPNPSELGCYLSHYKAIKTFLETDYEFGIILEDDSNVVDDFDETINALLECRDLWDVVKLSGRHNGMPICQKQLTAKRQLVARLFRHTGAAAYLVNRKAAQIYIDKLLPMKVPYDHEFDRAWVYGFKFRGVEPDIIIGQSFGETTIGFNHSEHISGLKKSQWKRGSTFLYRAWNEACRLIYYISRGLFIPQK